MKNRYRLLVFDWDGTLMDSAAHIVSSMRAAMDDLGADPLPDARLREVIGLGLREALDTLFPARDDSFKRRYTERYRAHFLDTHAPPELFPGAAEVLERLWAEGYLLAVATGKSRQGLARELRATGLERRIHASRCADETRSKPHPQMLTEILTELEVGAEHTLVVGDTEYDLEMARRAGARSLAALYGVHERERLLRQNPVGCLSAIEALPGWLAAATSPAGTDLV